LFLTAGLARQRALHARDDVVDVFAAAAQVRIVHVVEHGNQAVALGLERGGGAVVALADHRAQAFDQFRVVEQLRVRIDEFADLARQRAVQLAAQLGHVLARDREGAFEARDFVFDFGVGQRRVVDAEARGLLQPHASQRHPGRSCVTGEGAPHAPSSNLRSNSAATASNASASSGPSARNTSGMPMPAASIITPMMLFALTARPPLTSHTVALKPWTSCTSLAE